MSDSLIVLSEVHKKLAQITTVSEAKELSNQAAALHRYVKASKQGLEVQNQASFVKLLCERKAGELLLEVPRADKARPGRNEKMGVSLTRTLAEAGISEPTARRWQLLARWPEDELLTLLANCNQEEDELTYVLAIGYAQNYLESLKPTTQTRVEQTPPQPSAPSTPRQSRPATPIVSVRPLSPQKKLTDVLPRVLSLLDTAISLCEDVAELSDLQNDLTEWSQRLRKETGR